MAAASADSSNVSSQKPAASTKAVAHSARKSRTKASRHKRRSYKKASWRRGQQKIGPNRALEIQQALEREHYLKGQPSGVWDSATQAAMQRYQADHGWQTKVIPDSRALIGLGLGPDREHLLNPESAMTSEPKVQTDPAENDAAKSHVATPSGDISSPGQIPASTPADVPAPSPAAPAEQ
jgi:peptidoglycan hydrolase-like protein with peptidoglycan-binding domain